MKKIVSLMLALVFVCLAAAACGNNKSSYNFDLSDYIDLPEYKNIPAVGAPAEVTDEDVELQIMSTLNYYGRKVDVTDRPAQEGDYVTVDYAGYVDGMSTEPVTIQDTELCIGLGSMPEEFENALIGLNAGEVTQISIVLPDPFEEYPNYAGKTANLTVALKKIQISEAPEYTDDFVRAFLGHDTIEEYEQAVRDALVEKQHEAFYDITIPQVWGVILDNTEVKKYPDDKIKKYYDGVVDSVKNYVDTLGLDYEAFLTNTLGMTEEEFYESAMNEAQASVKDEMICHAIAKAENIKVSDNDYKTRGLEIAKEAYGLETLEELEEQFAPQEIRDNILCDMVKEFVAENAAITYENAD